MRQGVTALVRGAMAASAVVAAASWSGMAAAQAGGGRGGPPMDPAKAAAARALEAEGVAHDLGITGDSVGKMTAAYKTSRDSQAKAMEEMMATAERGPGMIGMMQELNDKERAKLKKDLDGCLKPDQATKAMASLGTYAREWDRFVDVLAGFGLDKEKQFKALTLIAKYVVDVDAARAKAMAAMDREGMQAASQENKSKLDDGLKGVLSADQLAKWTEGTAGRGGPGGGPGGGGPGGGRGPGGPGGPGGRGPGGPGGPGAGAPPPPAPKN